jgi:hypothetical protein
MLRGDVMRLQCAARRVMTTAAPACEAVALQGGAAETTLVG